MEWSDSFIEFHFLIFDIFKLNLCFTSHKNKKMFLRVNILQKQQSVDASKQLNIAKTTQTLNILQFFLYPERTQGCFFMAGKYNICSSSSFSVLWMINLFLWLFSFYMPVLFVTTGLCSCSYINWSPVSQIEFGWLTFDLFGAIKMRWNVTIKSWLLFVIRLALSSQLHLDWPRITTLAGKGGLHPQNFIFTQQRKWCLDLVSSNCTF